MSRTRVSYRQDYIREVWLARACTVKLQVDFLPFMQTTITAVPDDGRLFSSSTYLLGHVGQISCFSTCLSKLWLHGVFKSVFEWRKHRHTDQCVVTEMPGVTSRSAMVTHSLAFSWHFLTALQYLYILFICCHAWEGYAALSLLQVGFSRRLRHGHRMYVTPLPAAL